MSKLKSLSNNENFEALFSEIADDLAEAINGGTAHNCHQTHRSDLDELLPPSRRQKSFGGIQLSI